MLAKLNKKTLAGLPSSAERFDVRDTELKGFLLRVYPSGERTWWYQYRAADGQQTRVKLGNSPGLSPDAARQIAEDHAVTVGKGGNPGKQRRLERQRHAAERNSTLGAFIDAHYEPWALAHIKSHKPQLKRLRSDFKQWMGKPLAAIDGASLEALRREWKKAPSTVNRIMQRLQSVFSRAVEWGVLPVSPFKGFKQMKTDKRGRLRFLSADEEQRLRTALNDRHGRIAAARERWQEHRAVRGKPPLQVSDYLAPMVLLALNTGMRRGELFSLRWRDVDLDAKIVTVIGTSAKTGQTRHIPLNAEALALLNERYASRASDGLVFPGDEGEAMTNVNKSWRAVVTAAGLEAFRFHDCRHTFASRLVQAGVDLNTVRELLGHTDIAMTLRYAHLAPHNLRAAVELLGVP